MEKYEYRTQRRALAYITLLSGNLEAFKDFLNHFGKDLPFSPQFIDDFCFQCSSLDGKCDYSGRELVKRLTEAGIKKEVVNETH